MHFPVMSQIDSAILKCTPQKGTNKLHGLLSTISLYGAGEAWQISASVLAMVNSL